MVSSRHIRDPLRRGQYILPGAALVSPQAARLGAGVAAALGTSIQFGCTGAGTALHLADRSGRVLRNHMGGKRADRRGRPLEPRYPIRAAIIQGGPDGLIDVYFEEVPGTSVGYEGNRSDSVDEAIGHIASHYRAAVDPDAPPWHPGAWLGGGGPGSQPQSR